MCGLSTFCEHTTVSIASAVKIDPSIPLEVACLTGCSVGTGWGAAQNSAQVRPGQVVIVMGIGGIGINAVQGAAHAGASAVIAVDPVAFKRESALRLGATHATSTIKEAAAVGRELTDGQGADAALVTVGVTTGAHVGAALWAVRKAGEQCLRPVDDRGGSYPPDHLQALKQDRRANAGREGTTRAHRSSWSR